MFGIRIYRHPRVCIAISAPGGRMNREVRRWATEPLCFRHIEPLRLRDEAHRLLGRQCRYLAADILRRDGWHELAAHMERRGPASLLALVERRCAPGSSDGLPYERESVLAALAAGAI